MYKKLGFKSLEDFHHDVDLFNKKQHIRQNVRNLSILNMEHDVHTASTLPTFFPKVTSLEWSKTFSYRYARDSEVRHKLVFVGALQQWKDIESLVDCTKHLNIATRLLESTQCDRLTLLKISLEDWDDDNNIMHRNLLQELIDHIHNAPSLEHVSFNATAIRLSDMEKLRASLSKLNSVALQEVYYIPPTVYPILVRSHQRRLWNHFQWRIFMDRMMAYPLTQLVIGFPMLVPLAEICKRSIGHMGIYTNSTWIKA